MIGNKTNQEINANFVFTDGGNSGYSENFEYGEIIIGEEGRIELPKVGNGSIGDLYIGLNVIDETNINVQPYNNDFYKIEGNVLIGVEYEFASGITTVPNLASPEPITINGKKVSYNINEIEFTIYGNKIGIDLTDKTVYINGKTQKKVHSVDGNELMQTSNYLLDNDKNAIETMYGETRKEYERGKETATIRCSIGDYFSHINAKVVSYTELNSQSVSFVLDVGNEKFAEHISDLEIISNGVKGGISDYDGQTVSGAFWSSQIVPYLQTGNIEIYIKEISIDNSTSEMAFKMYDQVIPMVYGADGKDRPMSLYQDGSPKVFQVLGSKIYYDGAVWQELSLQEVDKSDIV